MVEYCDIECGQLSINWRTMGTSNETTYRPLPITLRNVHVHTHKPFSENFKTIVRPSYVVDDEDIDWSHTVMLKRGKWVDTNNKIIHRIHHVKKKGRKPRMYKGPTDVAALYHYRFKSEEEFTIKSCSRGDSLRKRGEMPKCHRLKKLGNYPWDGLEFDDRAWVQLKRMCPKYGIFDMR